MPKRQGEPNGNFDPMPLFLKSNILLGIAALSASTTQANEPLSSSPFSRAAETGATTLFTQLLPAETGLIVENQYDDPKMWTERYREFMGGGMGSGVCAGDFDQDGKVDLYVSTKTKPGRLFKNLGNWKFKDVTEQAGLSEEGSLLSWFSKDEIVWRQGAVFADVNNDGRLDLYVCRNNAPNLLYINQGNGKFEEEGGKRGLGISDGSVIGAFSDYDRDGWIDVLVLTNQLDGTESSGRHDRLFRNNGDGIFTEVTAASGIQGPTFGHAATWFDFDEDKWPDLYIANDFSGQDYLYQNNRDGTFTNVINEVTSHTPYSSMGADTTDVNNDGHIDLLVADMATTTRERDRRGLAASRVDVLTTGTTDGVVPQYTRNSLFINTGLGIFAEAACWAGIEATDWTWSVRFEDFDQDGWSDLHVTNGMVREANNSDLLALMMRALSDMQRIGVIKRAPPLEESNLAYRNLSGNGFEEVTQDWGLSDIGVTFGAATADFDDDGDLDLTYLDYNGGLKVFRNNAERRSIKIQLHGTDSNAYGIGAVVRIESRAAGLQSRTLTVARGYASGSEPIAHFGIGQDSHIEKLIVEWPSGIEQTFTGLETNRTYTVTETQPSVSVSKDAKHKLFEEGSKTFGLSLRDESKLAVPDKEQAFLPFRTDRSGPALAVADLDGDGHDDLFSGSTSGSPHALIFWKDDSYLPQEAGALASMETEHGPALIFDADGDGDPDLLTTQASANATLWPNAFKPALYANDGHGNFTAMRTFPNIEINAGAAVAADVDSDGDIDIFIGARSIPGKYPETPNSLLLINENGHFLDKTLELAPALAKSGLVKSALFRDVDRDGRPDLILALEWDYVRFFRNEGDGRFSDKTKAIGFESGGKGWWNGLVAADFNGDGRLDFGAGNLGLNSTYEASNAAPAVIYYGDFARNGTKLLAEAVYDDGELYPLRSRVDIGAKLPAVLRKFPKNDDFAKATLAEVYGQVQLDSAQRLEATNFRSGAFLSQTDGTYKFVPFPPQAQTGPILGLLAADLDGDGTTDLAGTQNTDVAIPRFHGGMGLFLKGANDGSFTPQTPDQTGILLPGNGRAIVLLDPNGDSQPDLFATRHGASSVHLSNNSEYTNWITLKLQGSAKNTDAIGAQVEVAYSDGSTKYHEIGLGGSWQSQSAPKLYLVSQPRNKPLSATIRWPDGSESSHAQPPANGTWLIEKGRSQ